MNSLTIVGRLTRDPEARTLTSGKTVANFAVAVDNQGKETGATFFNCAAWGSTADFVTTYLTKGRLVAVSGRIESRKYKDKEGNDREAWEVTAERVQGLDKPKDDDAGNSRTGTSAVARTSTRGADDYDPFADE